MNPRNRGHLQSGVPHRQARRPQCGVPPAFASKNAYGRIGSGVDEGRTTGAKSPTFCAFAISGYPWSRTWDRKAYGALLALEVALRLRRR